MNYLIDKFKKLWNWSRSMRENSDERDNLTVFSAGLLLINISLLDIVSILFPSNILLMMFLGIVLLILAVLLISSYFGKPNKFASKVLKLCSVEIWSKDLNPYFFFQLFVFLIAALFFFFLKWNLIVLPLIVLSLYAISMSLGIAGLVKVIYRNIKL